MQIPSIVYHGTFISDEVMLDSRNLETDYGYIIATPFKEYAEYFSAVKRLINWREPGRLIIYTIDTGRISEDIKNKAIPPDRADPRMKGWMLEQEKEMIDERVKAGEWRLPIIPLEAIIKSEERHEDAHRFPDIFYLEEFKPSLR